MLAELLLVQLDRPAAMPDFFLAHLFKYLRRAGKVFPQALAEVRVNTFVLFLQRNRQRKEFFLRQAVKVSQGCRLLLGNDHLCVVSSTQAQHLPPADT